MANRWVGLFRSVLTSLRGRVTCELPSRVDGFPTISGRKGHLFLGRGSRLFRGVIVQFESIDARVSIGRRTFVNTRSHIVAANAVSIGEDCAVSWDVLISDTDFHQLDDGRKSAPIFIGDHVWIGARAVILKGVSIGDGAVVAAGSVVTANVAAGALVAGVPARVVRSDVTWRL